MIVAGLDLASRSSALIQLGDGYTILFETDSYQNAEQEFIGAVVYAAEESDLLVIEDVPPSVAFNLQTKEVCVLQGRILQSLEERELHKKVMLVFPNVWQHFHGYKRVKGTTTKGWAKLKCIEFGYAPPPQRKTTLEWGAEKSKLLTDYRDAYLIARYAMHVAVASVI